VQAQGQESVVPGPRGLKRDLGLLALIATAVCTVIGGGINNLTVGIQARVVGVAWMVPLAYVLCAVPAVSTALCYAVLATAMPRAGGGYIYVSRALHPLVGFLATFSKWFGLAAAVGVIAYMDVDLLQAAADYSNLAGLSELLKTPQAHLWLPLAMIWVFWLLNVLGVRTYGATVVTLMFLMLAGGVCIIIAGLANTPETFASAWEARYGQNVQQVVGSVSVPVGGWRELLASASVLFFAYIGFASISQAGGEARDPVRTLPRAFVIAIAIITGYYLLFSYAVYKVAPWQLLYHLTAVEEAGTTAPHLIGVLLPAWLAVFVALMAAIALANDIPPMLMAVSRLFFSWARDGIFPRGLAAVSARFRTPQYALTISAAVATVVVLICYADRSFAAGVDVINIALTTTYCLVAIGVITFPYRNRTLYAKVRFLRDRTAQVLVALVSLLTVGVLLALQLVNYLGELQGAIVELAKNPAILWLACMVIGCIIFAVMWRRRIAQGWDMSAVFETLPEDEERSDTVI